MTPAIKLARKAGIDFQTHSYVHDKDAESYGEEAAEKLGQAVDRVFKTLVVEADDRSLAVAVVPVSGQLDLKGMASALKVKKVRMATPEAVERSTGYVLGGVSPLGQKRKLRTVIDCSARNHPTIYVSAGRRGLEIELTADDLAMLTSGDFAVIGR